MKCLSFLVPILLALYSLPGAAVAQNETNDTSFSLLIAKSGCCKVRKSLQHPWAKTSKSFEQCEADNKADGDNIYRSEGLYWWDRAC